MRAMVLAAGRGERLRPATDNCPKPLLEIGGQSLIGARIRRLAAAGVREIVVNLAYFGEKIRDALGDGTAFGVDIVYSEEGSSALDTGGGVRAALPLLGDDPFLVIAADVWTDFDFRLLTHDGGRDPRLVFVPNPPHRPGGDYSVAAGRIGGGGSRLTYAGLGRFDAAMFAGFDEARFGLSQVIDRALGQRVLQAQVHPGEWRDLGRPEDLAGARQLWGDRYA